MYFSVSIRIFIHDYYRDMIFADQIELQIFPVNNFCFRIIARFYLKIDKRFSFCKIKSPTGTFIEALYARDRSALIADRHGLDLANRESRIEDSLVSQISRGQLSSGARESRTKCTCNMTRIPSTQARGKKPTRSTYALIIGIQKLVPMKGICSKTCQLQYRR